MDEGIRDLLIQSSFPKVGSTFVDAAISEKIDLQARAKFTIRLGAVLVVICQKSAADAVACEHVATPGGQGLIKDKVSDVAIVVALGIEIGAAEEVEIK